MLENIVFFAVFVSWNLTFLTYSMHVVTDAIYICECLFHMTQFTESKTYVQDCSQLYAYMYRRELMLGHILTAKLVSERLTARTEQIRHKLIRSNSNNENVTVQEIFSPRQLFVNIVHEGIPLARNKLICKPSPLCLRSK